MKRSKRQPGQRKPETHSLIVLEKRAMDRAAKNGQLGCVRRLHDRGCQATTEVMGQAGANGHLAVVGFFTRTARKGARPRPWTRRPPMAIWQSSCFSMRTEAKDARHGRWPMRRKPTTWTSLSTCTSTARKAVCVAPPTNVVFPTLDIEPPIP